MLGKLEMNKLNLVLKVATIFCSSFLGYVSIKIKPLVNVCNVWEKVENSPNKRSQLNVFVKECSNTINFEEKLKYLIFPLIINPKGNNWTKIGSMSKIQITQKFFDLNGKNCSIYFFIRRFFIKLCL